MWRRSGESLIIGENLEIEVLELRPNKVKLGIVAPDSMSIVRKETRITQEANVTASWSMDDHMVQSLLKRFSR